MSSLRLRRGTALLIVCAAIVVAVLAASPQAGASTLYACVKKNGSAHIYAKKPKCKKHEKKLSWNTEGPAGKNGLNGTNGSNGTNGKNGTNGVNGQEGAPGSARAYAEVSSSVVFEGMHPGFESVERIETGKYCLKPTAASGLSQAGASVSEPGDVALVSVDWGWSSAGEKGSVATRQRPFGNCPAEDFEVYTFHEFAFANSTGFEILVP